MSVNIICFREYVLNIHCQAFVILNILLPMEKPENKNMYLQNIKIRK